MNHELSASLSLPSSVWSVMTKRPPSMPTQSSTNRKGKKFIRQAHNISSSSSFSFPVQPPPLTYQTIFYNQTLDHVTPFSSSSSSFFQQRILINDTYFGRGNRSLTSDDDDDGCVGPIFFYTGNEGPIEGFWDSNGFMQYLTVKYGGLLVMAEQRYYGQSLPSFSNLSSFIVLTTEQVLEDYVEILEYIKNQYSATSCPTIAFGGSYGATLSAFMRLKYPWAVQGALAASSELGYYDVDHWPDHGVTQYTFSDIIGKSYYDISPKCLQAIYDTAEAIDHIGRDDPDLVVATFNFCDSTALLPNPSSAFIYGLEGLPQMNYPYEIGLRPSWPVRSACNILLHNGTNIDGHDEDDDDFPAAVAAETAKSDVDPSTFLLLKRAATVTAMSLGYNLNDTARCFATLEEGPGNVPGDGPGRGSWGYQSCTETLHEFSSSKMIGIRKDDPSPSSIQHEEPIHYGLREYDFQTEKAALDELCLDMYGVTPNTRVLAERFGGYDIAKVTTNTIFSVGELDPWGGGGVTIPIDEDVDLAEPAAVERGVYFFRLQNGAHHIDLRGWHRDEPMDVRHTRLDEERIIVGWITQHFSDREASASMATVH